ncbi:hypothetical protein ACER0A_009960 [Haloimpatiens sp. FM7315]|uniref:hypothetical protein n=1 Tax=Haloimpatiens sp. FM7315 TaxID=3298609 RepID=UPI00370AAE23
MKKINKFIGIFLITSISCVFLLENCFYHSNANENLFNEIIESVDGKIIENGITTSFYVKNNGGDVCRDIKRNLGLNVKTEELNETNLYSIEFKDNKISGYIQSSKDQGKYLITLNLCFSCEKNQLENFKNKIEKSISNINLQKNNKYFCYVKAKIDNEDLNTYNDKIINLLKKKHVNNIQSVKINNGYNTVCYTGRYDVIKVNRGIVDFNYAICRYESGSYVIIGTPQIIMNY